MILARIAAEFHLTINKLWTRKQDPAVVGSISLMAKLVGLVPVTMFLVDGTLRQSVENDMLTSLPPKQAMQMPDVIALIVAADGKVTEEEDTMLAGLAELTGLLGTYAGGGAAPRAHLVALVPRSPEHGQAVETLVSCMRRQPMVGGVAFVAGRFYSTRCAELVSQQHRTLNFFSVVLDQQLHDDLARQVLPA